VLAVSLAAIAAWRLIPAACQAQDIHLKPIWQRDDWFILALHTFGQTLNEEIVLGWILLSTLQRRLPRLRLPVISLIVALVFSSLHFVFYSTRPRRILTLSS
jgi:membrane protease YdiL (CAAX protease family)